MKIIILINSLGAGGAERSMVEFAKFLTEFKQIKFKILCLKHKKIGLEKEVSQAGIETVYHEGNQSFYSKLNFFNSEIEKEKPQIVHSVLTESNIIARISRIQGKNFILVQSLVNTPYSVERKKDNELPWFKFQIMKQIDIWTARLNSHIFYHAITEEVLDHYRKLFKIKDNYKVIYRGRRENILVNKIKRNQKFTIVNSGRQEFAKGQLDILKALKLLEDEYGIRDIHLEILGRPGTYSEKLEKYIEMHNLQQNVTIHGFVDNVYKTLASCHIFVFPSYYEGLGGALVEAFASRLPCICSNIPVLQEVVGSKEGALFSEPGDIKTLAVNIKTLYHDAQLRNELGDYSFERFKEAFKMDEINLNMLNMYKSLVKHS